MIIDTAGNANRYVNMHRFFAKAFEFLQNTDLMHAESGKYMIEGEEVFAIVQEYTSRNIAECRLEAHRKYVDIQYIVSGEELIGVNLLSNQRSKDGYDEMNDVIFFEGDFSLIKMVSGMFAIFYPDDLHMPGITSDHQTTVKKVVIKVRV